MNEQELRSLVREAVERHLRVREPFPQEVVEKGARIHSSHILLKVAPGSEIDEGACVIEPAVRCNHCGFCQSFGH
jgi:hypothetical protein